MMSPPSDSDAAWQIGRGSAKVWGRAPDDADVHGRPHLLRNIGSSIYISLTVGLVVRSTTINYAEMSESVTPFNERLQLPSIAGSWTAGSVEGLVQLSDELQR